MSGRTRAVPPIWSATRVAGVAAVAAPERMIGGLRALGQVADERTRVSVAPPDSRRSVSSPSDNSRSALGPGRRGLGRDRGGAAGSTSAAGLPGWVRAAHAVPSSSYVTATARRDMALWAGRQMRSAQELHGKGRGGQRGRHGGYDGGPDHHEIATLTIIWAAPTVLCPAHVPSWGAAVPQWPVTVLRQKH